MSMSSDVLTFVQACDQTPSPNNVELYFKLIEEELEELIVAREESDEVEQLDACMDLIWVILGYAHMKGYQVEPAWAEVARSNLDKIDKITGKVIKREDGKVLKPADWKEPQLSSFIKAKM